MTSAAGDGGSKEVAPDDVDYGEDGLGWCAQGDGRCVEEGLGRLVYLLVGLVKGLGVCECDLGVYLDWKAKQPRT